MRVNRRSFTGLLAGAAAGRVLGANDRIRVGMIGTGGRGRELMRILCQFPDCDIAAVSDVIESRMEEALAVLKSAARPQTADRYVDYRSVLDRKDIDAVFIATTQHWHGIPFLHAVQARKPIFIEKPLSHTVVEGRIMVEAARKHGVLAVMGTQQRSGPHYHRAVELIRTGRLGRVALVESFNYSNTGARTGRPPDSEPPPGVHWNEWLGPAPWAPFNPARLNSSWWFDYGGGMLTNWAVHHIDIILWAMNYPSPIEVSAVGGKLVVDDLADTYDTLECAWEFPGWVMSYRYRGFNNYPVPWNRRRNHGIVFFGSEGTLVVDRFGFELYDERDYSRPAEKMDGIPWLDPKARNLYDPRTGQRTDQDGPFQRMFLDAVKEGRKELVPTIEQSHAATLCCHLGNIAYRLRRRIRWDAAHEKIPGDAEAEAMLHKQYRAPFVLPKV